jgi:HEAT repeat protein
MQLFGPPNVEKLKTNSDVRGLIKALSYKKEAFVRAGAAKALGELKGPGSVEPLVVALKDSDYRVQREAAKALGKLNDPSAVEPLTAVFKEDSAAVVCEAAAEALVCIGTPAIEPIIAVLKNTPNSLRWGTPEADAYYGAIEALKKIGPSAVEPLIAALKDGNKGIRQASAKALGVLEDPRSVEPLIAALKDSAEYVRKAAANALVCIGTPAIEPLIGVLKDGNKEVPREAFKALGRIKDPRVIELLISMLKDSDKDVRWQAAEALESLGWQPGRDENGAAYWVAKKEKRYPSSFEEIMRQFDFSYYFLLTFSSEDEAKIFWERITSRQDPPVPTVLLWGSWISLDYGNAQRWFVAWLTDGESYSNAIDRWWHTFRPKDTPAGASYGSPNSPLGVRMKIDKVYEEKKLRCT